MQNPNQRFHKSGFISRYMASTPSKKLYDRLHNDKTHQHFVTKWLTKINRNYTPPAMAIINGWMSEHYKNQWYAEILSKNMNIFSFDSRGQGNSPKSGQLNAIQGAIDASTLVFDAFQTYDEISKKNGDPKANKILQGNCVGTMSVAALFAGKLPLASQIDGTILISPVSTFSLPFPIKLTFFLPVWFVGFAIKNIAPTFAKLSVPGEESDDSRNEAMSRLNKIDPKIAVKQTRQVFWKENVSKYWKHVKVPSLILVGNSDPIVKIHHSFEAYDKLPYPIWLELDAPDHLLLERNMDSLGKLIPEFAKDPWSVYEEYKYLRPKRN
ncbi:MAG: hypothetical protein HeimC2_13900 [Candidatus Heimdallarchaeota archaeon LC_2]|nr:MAG: hypothetical protein HeimC2_13900 [Candidatus Heimdallarchaeota archaeon LC_2]